mgnify:CR=1 FL=1|jgi:hypothetical protein
MQKYENETVKQKVSVLFFSYLTIELGGKVKKLKYSGFG